MLPSVQSSIFPQDVLSREEKEFGGWAVARVAAQVTIANDASDVDDECSRHRREPFVLVLVEAADRANPLGSRVSIKLDGPLRRDDGRRTAWRIVRANPDDARAEQPEPGRCVGQLAELPPAVCSPEAAVDDDHCRPSRDRHR